MSAEHGGGHGGGGGSELNVVVKTFTEPVEKVTVVVYDGLSLFLFGFLHAIDSAAPPAASQA